VGDWDWLDRLSDSWELGVAGISDVLGITHPFLVLQGGQGPITFGNQQAEKAEKAGATPEEVAAAKAAGVNAAAKAVGEGAYKKAAYVPQLQATLDVLKMALYVAVGVAAAILVLLYAPRRRT